MGTDKAFLEIDNLTMLQRVACALHQAGAASVLVVGGDRRRVADLGMPHVVDMWPSQGPLGGIITALHNISAETVAVLSCDLTQPQPSAVEALLGHLRGADVAVPVCAGQPQWLHAVWRRSALGALQGSFAAGVRAPRHAVSGLNVTFLRDLDPDWFHDADYPADLPDGSVAAGSESVGYGAVDGVDPAMGRAPSHRQDQSR